MKNRAIQIILSLCAGFLLLLAVFMAFSRCLSSTNGESPEFQQATEVSIAWNKMLLELEWQTPGYRPPVSARMFAYAGMTAYEASLPALPDHISMEKYCRDYKKPEFSEKDFLLPASLNTAYARIARSFFPTAPQNLLDKMTALEQSFNNEFASKASHSAVQQSTAFGAAVANAVWQYSAMDSIGHDAFMFNYDRNFSCNAGPGKWKPDEKRPLPPLLPHWGDCRPFMVKVDEFVARPPAEFSQSTSSAYYSEAFEVYSLSQTLSSEDKWIAEFWSDDLPGLTVTPVGRWISIANQAIEKSNLEFENVIDLYLKLGIALYDGSIVGWANKYRYEVERPETFIRHNIQPGWSPLHKSPNFPSYPSGHSMFGSVSEEILSAYLGDHFAMTDRTHENRLEFAGKARSFNSFEEMAAENAYSRVLIGVHYRMDCEEGLRLGKIIGQKAVALNLRKKKVAMINTN